MSESKPTHVVDHPKLYLAVGGKLAHVPKGTPVVLTAKQAEKLGNKVVSIKEQQAVNLAALEAEAQKANDAVKKAKGQKTDAELKAEKVAAADADLKAKQEALTKAKDAGVKGAGLKKLEDEVQAAADALVEVSA